MSKMTPMSKLPLFREYSCGRLFLRLFFGGGCCFLVIEARGGTWFRTPCPIVVRSRSKCQRQRPGPVKRVGSGLRFRSAP